MRYTYLDVQATNLLEQSIMSEQQLRRLANEIVLGSFQDHTFFNITVRPELFHLSLTEKFDHDVTLEGASSA